MHTLFSDTNKTVQTLVTRLINNDPTLEEINCTQLNLDCVSSEKIFNALKHNIHIKKLKFLGNNSKGAIKSLAESIRTHQSLEEIYLGTNGLNDEEFFYLAHALKDNLSSVQLLDINSNEEISDISASHIAELIEQSTHIKKMDISFTNITDQGLQEILNTLEKNPQSSLYELCEPELLYRGYLTNNEVLTQKLSDLFNQKKNHADMNTFQLF